MPFSVQLGDVSGDWNNKRLELGELGGPKEGTAAMGGLRSCLRPPGLAGFPGDGTSLRTSDSWSGDTVV